MKGLLFALLLTVGVIAAPSAAAAETEWYRIHGNSCTSISSGLTPKYSVKGIYASGTTGIWVTCPVPLVFPLGSGQLPTRITMAAQGYSLSPTSSVFCNIVSTYDGSQGRSAYSTIPYAQGQWRQGNFADIDVPLDGYTGSVYVTCSLPPATASQYSFLTSLWIQVGRS